MKTVMAKSNEVKKEWFVVDAKDKILGRVASKVAHVLIGKHKTMYTPNVDTGDFVVVLNADKIRVTGKKLSDKIYKHYSGYPSGQKVYTLETLLKRRPKDVISFAVKNMLPKSILGRKMFRKLKVYIESEKPSLPKNIKNLEI